MLVTFLLIMKKIKNQIKTNKVVESGDYYFTGSFARYGAIESIDIEKNKINAINNFLIISQIQ